MGRLLLSVRGFADYFVLVIDISYSIWRLDKEYNTGKKSKYHKISFYRLTFVFVLLCVHNSL